VKKPRTRRDPSAIVNRTVTPRRPPNADLREREYLTPKEVDRLQDYSRSIRIAHPHRKNVILRYGGSLGDPLLRRKSPKVQGKFLSRLKTLAHFELQEWKVPLFRWLHGDCHPLGEIRFEIQNVQHRPLGYRAAERVFTLTFCAKEKSDRFVPPNGCEIGLRNKANIENGSGSSNVCWLRLE
jgi:hypothetical protein